VPMFELNRAKQDPKAVGEMVGTLTDVTNREIDLARGLILLARARLDIGDLDGADEAVEKVLTLRKEHAFASELRRRIGEARAEAKAKAPPEPAPAPTP
jgi:Tfp pilus assembly protein FimV